MMKSSTVGILLFLMSLAVTPRTISATSGNPVIDAIAEGTSLLTDCIKEITIDLNSVPLDNGISKLEEQMVKFPIEITTNQKLLEKLYRSQDHIGRLRNVLENIATQLKSQCEGILVMYMENEKSLDLLNYSAKQFLKVAKDTKKSLKSAYSILKDTQKELATTETILQKYESEIDMVESELQNLEDTQPEVEDRYQINETNVTANFTIDDKYMVATSIPLSEEEVLINELVAFRENVDLVRMAIHELVIHTDQLRSYAKKEFSHIFIWETKLQKALSDNEDGISDLEVKNGIDGLIIPNLNALIEAY